MQIHEISFSDHSKIKKNVAKTRFDDKTCACLDTSGVASLRQTSARQSLNRPTKRESKREGSGAAR